MQTGPRWKADGFRFGRGSEGSYRVGRDGVLDVEVEAKVDHVENSVAPQS